MVTNGWMCATGVVAGCENVKDISTCGVGIATVEACAMASASLTWVSQFWWKGAGSYPTFIFLGLASLSILCLVTMALLFTGVALGHFVNGKGLSLDG